MKAVYGVEGLVCFNLATFMGYKIYVFCYEMLEFVTTGSLPTKHRLRLRKRCILLCWLIAVSFLSIYIGLNTYWMIATRQNWPDIQYWQLSFNMAHFLCYLVVSIFYMVSAAKLYKMRKLSEIEGTECSSRYGRRRL